MDPVLDSCVIHHPGKLSHAHPLDRICFSLAVAGLRLGRRRRLPVRVRLLLQVVHDRCANRSFIQTRLQLGDTCPKPAKNPLKLRNTR